MHDIFTRATHNPNSGIEFEIRNREATDAIFQAGYEKRRVAILLEGYVTSIGAQRDNHFPDMTKWTMAFYPIKVTAVSSFIEETETLRLENDRLREENVRLREENDRFVLRQRIHAIEWAPAVPFKP